MISCLHSQVQFWAVVPGKIHMSCISFNITVVVDVFSEIFIDNLKSLFTKGIKKTIPSFPPNELLQNPHCTVVKTVDRAIIIISNHLDPCVFYMV